MITRVGRLSIPARAPHTVTRDLDGEFLVLDEPARRALSLSGPAATVWASAGTTADVDPAALAELTDLGLLEAPGLTRRSMLMRTGAIAAGLGIASVMLPVSADAASLVAGITLTPGTGSVGTTVTVSGLNFPANSGPVQITFDGATMTVTSTQTSGTGSFSVTFVVPSATLGNHTVAATAGGKSATATFTVIGGVVITPNPLPLNSSPTSATIVGGGFTPGDIVTEAKVSGDTLGFSSNTFTADANGAISGTRTLTYPNGNKSGVVSFTDQHGHTFNVAWSVI